MNLKCLVFASVFSAIFLAGCKSFPRKSEPKFEVITKKHRALAARVELVLKEIEGTPVHEAANCLRTWSYPEWIRKLKGEGKAKKGELDQAMKEIPDRLADVERNKDFPRPPLAKVPFTASPPKIDGKLDDQTWTKAITYTETYPFNKREKIDTPKTTWKILWDNKFLYFAFDCADTNIVSPNRERDDHVYSDDCVEMFILPEFRSRTYWELVIGPSGSIFDSIQSKKYYQWGFTGRKEETIQGLRTGIELRGTLNQQDDVDQGYSVEVAFPFSELPGYSRTVPQAGHRLHFMLVRLDRQSEEQFGTYAYQPLLSWGHNIWNHAVMELAK